jgi:hypothetical protein
MSACDRTKGDGFYCCKGRDFKRLLHHPPAAMLTCFLEIVLKPLLHATGHGGDATFSKPNVLHMLPKVTF